MKKTSILLIALSLFAMIFSSCSQMVGSMVNDNTTATLEDFQGTWNWSLDDQSKAETVKTRSLSVTIENDNVTITNDKDDNSKNTEKFKATVNNGILTATRIPSSVGGFLESLLGTKTLQMTVKQSGMMITLSGEILAELVGWPTITLTKFINLDWKAYQFKPKFDATYNDFMACSWKHGNDMTVSFQSLNGLNFVIGLDRLPGLVVVVKGAATTKIGENMYMIYMNETKDQIAIVGPAIKKLKGEYFYRLNAIN